MRNAAKRTGDAWAPETVSHAEQWLTCGGERGQGGHISSQEHGRENGSDRLENSLKGVHACSWPVGF